MSKILFPYITCLLFFITNIFPIEKVCPPHIDRYVNDFAKVLDDTSKSLITRAIKEVETKTGAELTVVTINSLKDYADHSIDSLANKVLNKWGIGKKENNGALLLVALNDNNAKIALGKGFPEHYNNLMKSIINTKIAPSLRNKQYNQGIYDGTLAIAQTISKESSWFDYHINPLLKILLWMLLLILPIYLLFTWIRKRRLS